MMLMLLLLTALGDLFALIGGALTSQPYFGRRLAGFFPGRFDGHLLDEYFTGLVKALSFGASISIVSCHYGLGVSGGATGVGRAVNGCVVTSAIGIFVWDYLITYLANAR